MIGKSGWRYNSPTKAHLAPKFISKRVSITKQLRLAAWLPIFGIDLHLDLKRWPCSLLSTEYSVFPCNMPTSSEDLEYITVSAKYEVNRDASQLL